MRRLCLSLLLLGGLCSCVSAQSGARSGDEAEIDDAPETQLLHPRAPKVPAFSVFAGDTLYLDRDDFRERMDREMLAFTYMHSNSFLILKRSARIFAMVEPILKAQGVPEDLKYLMLIESNLDPKAVSRTGAVGLWQFMKAAAGDYGLEVSAEVDERYNIEKETIAACKYLKRSYLRFGDWMTAAASYNAGVGAIGKALAEQKQTSALELWLTEETSRYMFRLHAAKLFCEHPELFGFSIDDEDKYPYRAPREVVTVSDSIPSLVDFAIEHGTTYAALRNANLWLLGTKLTNASKKTYKIYIP